MVNWLLLPFSGIYGLIMDVRNWLFDNKLFQSTTPLIRSVSVGNLTVGGTGKTPMVEFLIKWYVFNTASLPFELATLSRGYGRQTTGFRIATEADTAATLGDEPLQLYRKFTNSVRVCVGERRVDAIQALLAIHPDTRLVLLDDAFQHRSFQPHVSILLMDYNRPFYEDFPFPAGRLRERRHGASRADVVVVTKCPPELADAEQQRITNRIRPYTQSDTPIYFATLQYGEPVSFATHQQTSGELGEVVLVSGLANATPLETYARQTYRLRKHIQFADHYNYTRSDLDPILATLSAGTSLLTTEKDWVKVDALLTPEERTRYPLFYLPVSMQLLPGSEKGFTDYLTTEILKNR
ncbi:tetraacyldisaccharide 4'-kinase [Spirosoma soli]|uniref:Tetraacyldisaccharide 4'-kinase n=1 Tax=Spirosoma soli TaxID=1770529 RepID=A0ABW5M577_9BACT